MTAGKGQLHPGRPRPEVRMSELHGARQASPNALCKESCGARPPTPPRPALRPHKQPERAEHRFPTAVFSGTAQASLQTNDTEPWAQMHQKASEPESGLCCLGSLVATERAHTKMAVDTAVLLWALSLALLSSGSSCGLQWPVGEFCSGRVCARKGPGRPSGTLFPEINAPSKGWHEGGAILVTNACTLPPWPVQELLDVGGWQWTRKRKYPGWHFCCGQHAARSAQKDMESTAGTAHKPCRTREGEIRNRALHLREAPGTQWLGTRGHVSSRREMMAASGSTCQERKHRLKQDVGGVCRCSVPPVRLVGGPVWVRLPYNLLRHQFSGPSRSGVFQ